MLMQCNVSDRVSNKNRNYLASQSVVRMLVSTFMKRSSDVVMRIVRLTRAVECQRVLSSDAFPVPSLRSTPARHGAVIPLGPRGPVRAAGGAQRRTRVAGALLGLGLGAVATSLHRT